NGEWKVWSKDNIFSLIVIHEKERKGAMSLIHAFDREEGLLEFMAEVPTEVAHREKCKRNLQSIEAAKSQATRSLKLASGIAVEPAQLSTLIPGGYESVICPDAGTYA